MTVFAAALPRRGGAEPGIGRAFIVGCPRSGTTLLQSLLFAHPDVVSFPETFFFVLAVPGSRLRRRLRVAGRRAPSALDSLRVAGLEPQEPWGIARFKLGAYARAFVDAADRAARSSGARLWIEKTPNHVSYIPEIERYVEGARIVHLFRSGPAVMASLRKVIREHPDTWDADESVPELIAMWKAAVRKSASCAGRPNHAFVMYEDLVTDTAGILRKLCTFLGARSDDEAIQLMLRDYPHTADAVTGGRTVQGKLTREPWKAATGARIRSRNQDRLERIFNSAELAEITAAAAREAPTLERIPFLPAG